MGLTRVKQMCAHVYQHKTTRPIDFKRQSTKMEPGSKEQNQRRDETEVFTLHSQNTRDKDIQ